MAIPSIPIVETLPPAEASYRGHMFRVYLEGQDDQLVMCVKLADGTHNWVDVLVEPAFGTMPGTYAEGSHLHDDRYYTETEINSQMAGKSNTSHLHDDRYYTETESDGRYPSNATFNSHANLLGDVHGHVQRVLNANFVTTSTSLVTITDLGFPVDTGQVWQVDAYLPHNTSANNGLAWGINSPLNTVVRGHVTGTGTGFNSWYSIRINAATGWTGSLQTLFISSDVSGYAEIHALLRVGASGTISPTLLSGNSANTVTVLKDAYLSARRIS